MTQTKDRQDADMSTDNAVATLAEDREAIAAFEGRAPSPDEPAPRDDVHEFQPTADHGTAAETALADAPAADTSTEASTDENGTEPPLLDSELEDGIATIFAALQSATPQASGYTVDDSDIDDADLAAMLTFGEPDDDTDGESEAFDTSTFRLLGELDRLWHRAA